MNNPKTTAGIITERPNPVDGLKITSEKMSCKVTLTWNKTDNAESYDIYRANGRYVDLTPENKISGKVVKINSSPVTELSFTDSEGKSPWGYYRVVAVNSFLESEASEVVSNEIGLFGEDTFIFNSDDDMALVQKMTQELFTQQEAAQFDTGRYALLFKEGEYPVSFKVGFYTHVAGLGKVPANTVIEDMNVDARWLGRGRVRKAGERVNNNATCNFWRAVENVQINTDTVWAVSQAAPMRRLHINGTLILEDGGWASGGFLADSYVESRLTSGSQQQWLSRNCSWNSWRGENWNMVFVGNTTRSTDPEDVLADNWVTGGKHTVIDKTPIIMEKPFLYLEDSEYKVFLPSIKHDTVGLSWTRNDMGAGTSLPLDDFYIIHKGTTSVEINAQLQNGKNLIFTPGIYQLSETIHVTRENTVILGLGLATLVPNDGIAAMDVADVGGVKIAGLIFDAGPVSSPVLLKVGSTKNEKNADNPILLSDLFFRVGGNLLGKAAISLEINSSNVIGDHFWIWRADHGKEVSWFNNTAENGLIVNGDNVTIYALMVEHYQGYETLWNGNGGRMYFYQNELPYDPPSQELWMNGDTNGYAAYKVAGHVTAHEAYGMGMYVVFNRTDGAYIILDSAIEAPVAPGVKFHHVCTVYITGTGEITHVINDSGGTVRPGGTNRREVIIDY